MPYKRIYTQTHRQWILLHCTRLSSRTVVWQSALALSILSFKSKSVMASPKVSVFALRRNELQWWILNFSMFHTPLYMYYMCVLSHLSIYRHITHTYTFAVSLCICANSQQPKLYEEQICYGLRLQNWRVAPAAHWYIISTFCYGTKFLCHQNENDLYSLSRIISLH